MNLETPLTAFARSPSVEQSTWYKGILISSLVSETDSGGAFEFVETKMKQGTEPPPHMHAREHEMFFVLAGSLKVYVGAQCLHAGVGECVFLPKGQPHAFRIQSPEVHMLVLMTPGGFLNATAAMAMPAESLNIPPEGITYATADLGETIELFEKVGVRFLSPGEIARDLPCFPADLPLSSHYRTDASGT